MLQGGKRAARFRNQRGYWQRCHPKTGINFTQSGKFLKNFKTVGQDRAVLQGMRMSHTKLSNVVKNVLSPYEKERDVKSLQNCKFSLT